MCCPECHSDEIYEASATATEPHGESHSEVFLRCSACRATFDEADALSESGRYNIAVEDTYYEQEAA